jgi:hypothetical protein
MNIQKKININLFFVFFFSRRMDAELAELFNILCDQEDDSGLQGWALSIFRPPPVVNEKGFFLFFFSQIILSFKTNNNTLSSSPPLNPQRS